MSIKNKDQLKSRFVSGAKPQQEDFESLIDSLLHVDDAKNGGLTKANPEESRAGNADDRYMTPLRVKNAINALTRLANISELSTEVQAKIDAAIIALKDGVAVDGDTLKKLRALVAGLESAKLNKTDIPAGVIWMWSGATDAVPSGWALCDGANGRPDLRGRFVVGYDPRDSDYDSLGKTGGEKRHVLLTTEMPSHNHSVGSAGGHTHYINYAGEHKHQVFRGWNQGKNGAWSEALLYYGVQYDQGGLSWSDNFVASSGSHNHSMDTAGAHTHAMGSVGGGEEHENRPPYYTLAFIIKL